MTGAVIDLDQMVEEAIQVVDPTGPTRVLLALTRMSNPFECDDEAARKMLDEACQADLGTIYRHGQSGRHLNKDERAIWIDRIAWLLASMRGFKEAQASNVVLPAMLLTSKAFKGSIWAAIPPEFYTPDMLDCMSAIVERVQYTLDAQSPQVPCWEREAFRDFLQAEREGDWPAIASSWNTIYPAIWSKPDLSKADLLQLVVCLNATELGQKALAAAIDKMDGIIPIMWATAAMTPSQIANVALHSASKRTRFVLIQALLSGDLQDVPCGEDVMEILATVFRTTQGDPDEWTKWLRAFNRNPARTIWIQPALGASLGNSSDSIKSAYVYAINLYPTVGGSREAVSKCFEEFRKHALLDDRKSMWRVSYRRWDKWNFDKANGATSLFEIAFCDLDYAIIGYYVECLSDSELTVELDAINDALIACQDEWYKDHLSFKDAWYRLLSRYQIATYAYAVRNDEQPWELPMKIYLPFDPETNLYAAMTLETHVPYV